MSDIYASDLPIHRSKHSTESHPHRLSWGACKAVHIMDQSIIEADEQQQRIDAYLHYIGEYSRLLGIGSLRDATHQRRVAELILPSATRKSHKNHQELTSLYKRHVDNAFMKREELQGLPNTLGDAHYELDLSVR